jgi:hypothetical protein
MISSKINPPHLIGYTAHLVLLVISPDACPNMFRICATTCTSFLTGLMNTAASSAYKLILIVAALEAKGERNPSSEAR